MCVLAEFVNKYFGFIEKSVERAALAALRSATGAAPPQQDERKKMACLNFRLPLERPVALDASVSDSEWEHFQRIVHFYVDFRLKKVRMKWVLWLVPFGRVTLPCVRRVIAAISSYLCPARIQKDTSYCKSGSRNH